MAAFDFLKILIYHSSLYPAIEGRKAAATTKRKHAADAKS